MAGKYNFTILQGATFGFSVKWEDTNGNDIDLTDCNARMQIRYGNHNGEIAVDLTSENEGISIDLIKNTINIRISAEQTEKIKPISCVYDLEIVKGNTVTRLLEGKVKISAEVTK